MLKVALITGSKFKDAAMAQVNEECLRAEGRATADLVHLADKCNVLMYDTQRRLRHGARPSAA